MDNSGFKFLIGFMILAVVVILVVLPATITSINSNNTSVATTSNEIWTGSAGVAHTMASGPVYSITTMQLSTPASKYNDTVVNSWATSTNTRTLSVSTARRTDTTFNVTVTSQFNTTGNVTVTLNGHLLGQLSSTSDSWTGLDSSWLTDVTNITFANTTTTNTNVTNSTIVNSIWVTNSSYSVTNGQVVPVFSGAYRTTYVYTSQLWTPINTLLMIIPLLIAAFLVMYVFKVGVF